MWGTNDCESFAYLITLISDNFSNRHIDKLEVSPRINHKILGLNISTDNKILM